MLNFIVCKSKINERVALIPEDEIDQKEWLPNGQIITAHNWQEAREEVDESNLYRSPLTGEYFYVN